MKKYLFLAAALFSFYSVFSQQKTKAKKYPSLFWEISGNGLKKPSYLFGTMHVSSKIAFNLSDSFYLAIKSSDVVALENNPESWQDDMSKLDFESLGGRYDEEYEAAEPDDYFTIQSLRMNKYEKKLEIALFSKPPVINNLLYRSLSEVTADFEEDTYLDLYIFQTGRRLGKRVAGVEKYEESMRLMNEAFQDAAKEKNKKEKSFEYDDEYSPDKLQDAYRSGNLDLLDSINRLNSQSDAFDEKFLYRRNEIQADGIDSILKKSSLFVGVGAAHLPGERGVIEILRKKGYKLRPIFMRSRDSRQKDAVEKIRVPVTFATQTAEDGFFKVDIPGKLYRLGESVLLDQQHYADMANGSFYMVTRVKTNSLFWGHSTDLVAKKLDSVLYENVPGKILSKSEITRNGYRGFDISSRTRRGDFNRYHIFITPYEVLFFRMSGNGDYVKEGDEAKKFFNSIQLKEFKNEGWKKYQPAYGGFLVELPHVPYESIDANVQYDAEDKTTGQHFSIIRTDIHNYDFAEEDSFDLRLMDESFASSEFIDKSISSRKHIYKGYPAMDATYRHKDGTWFQTRFIIRGPHYFTLVAHGKEENKTAAEKFFNSFAFTPYQYKEQKERKDTAMGFTVKSTWFPEEKKETIEFPDRFSFYGEEDEDAPVFTSEDEEYKNRLIKNDTTGEAVYISFSRWTKYEYIDSIEHSRDKTRFLPGYDTSWIIRSEKKSVLPNGMKVLERLVTDTGSSRAVLIKKIYNNGISFFLTTQTDTLSQPSSFIKSFFETFTPADTLKGTNPYVKKSKIFFDDFFSTDSTLRKKAIASVAEMRFDSTDLPMLIKAINSFQWSERNYLERKISFINELGNIPVKASADLLRDIYFNAGDTINLQHSALEALLQQQTQYAYNLFSNIITTDPPVLETGNSYTDNYVYRSPLLPVMGRRVGGYGNGGFSNGRFMDELYDSLKLTRTILPALLPLMNLDDYEQPLMNLLQTMVDSNMVTAKDYEIYASKFLIEAKQELKKQAIEEKKSAIDKAEDEKKTVKSFNMYRNDDTDQGNDVLITYATLLLPFRETNPAVDDLLKKMLSSNDKRLKYNTTWLYLRHKLQLPDTQLSYFAKMDEYRFELFNDLRELKMLDKFPAAFKSQQELAKSRLMTISSYNKPDSVVYLDSLPVVLKKQRGFLFFYKYKSKKDDAFWKLARVGILSRSGNIFKDDERDEDDESSVAFVPAAWNMRYAAAGGNFTELTDEKIKDDESLKKEMDKQVKKIIYSSRKSGRRFFTELPDYSNFNMRYFD